VASRGSKWGGGDARRDARRKKGGGGHGALKASWPTVQLGQK
jgi:hypothetical protein